MDNKNIKFKGKTEDRHAQKTAEPAIAGASLSDRLADALKPPSENAKPADPE